MTKKEELEQAKGKLQDLLTDLQVAESRVAMQQRRVAALAELASLDEGADAPTGLVSGITDAVRSVFMASAGMGEEPLMPKDVANRVVALGIPPQSNVLASVLTIIRRLLESGEIERIDNETCAGSYRWKGRQGRPKIVMRPSRWLR
jgi:hypothetical protein